ncbi:MAG: hypothetical protein K9J16_08360 [Melioribacteraceae bacterium]|nr:hypothetical protein [Melioribacteraceae bacterium]MCF8353163.1 hypothetical protein [Melioribacteraceae bacterium]MCF8393137.1 hypothetical protein [Melioribacteraceae bacterium]MCF8418040.1 hypothetical protein [Melioribacteraceae bacterium]
MKRICISSLIFALQLNAQVITEISDNDWRLWTDTSTEWENDELYLPGEFELEELPVNEPTGGWEVLNNNTGKIISLPSTVEQHFWGEFGFREYDNEYYFENEDSQVKNGNYKGVSWWWKEIEIPEKYNGKIINLNIRGARQRAEVYLNEKLVGYNLITETSFTCDITTAAKPGEKNLLAIRITNPGGEMDWVDTKMHKWGDYEFHFGHGFGGLDRGLTLTSHEKLYIDDLWVANSPQPEKVYPHVSLVNTTDANMKGLVTFEIYDSENLHEVLKTQSISFFIEKGNTKKFETELIYQDAKLWDIDSPNLYVIKVIIQPEKISKEFKETSSTVFGFRSFTAEGIGENAVLKLNGKRIRLISAISWGYWGLNGLFPSTEFAEREVMAAKRFGMNCIQFHRNIGKTEVLDAQDQLGLLRYMEPGGGQSALGKEFTLYTASPEGSIDISGKNGEAKTFAEKYMEEKLIRMIKDHRSHPSLILYGIQNEINPDLRNPRIFNLIRKMHNEDPSRVVMLKSGIPPHNQVWMAPYDTTVYYDKGDGYSGWWDQHTVGGPGVWKDDMYKSNSEFTHFSDNTKEIVTWGEMLGAAVPDNHSRMIREIEESGGDSYDLEEHKEILSAYDSFLDKWKFRDAFPTAEDLFLDIGDKSYDFWGRVIETARLAEANDFLVISGWESTVIENHSGLLDNLRGFKGDPDLLKNRFSLIRPVIKSKTLVYENATSPVIDIYLLNETTANAGKTLSLELITPGNEKIKMENFSIPLKEKDVFVYPIEMNYKLPVFDQPGRYSVILKIDDNDRLKSIEKFLVLDLNSELDEKIKTGVICYDAEFIDHLNTLPNIDAKKYKDDEDYDVILISSQLLYGWKSIVEPVEIENTENDELFLTESWGYDKNLEYVFTDIPQGPAKVTLLFAEVTLSGPKARVFDVAINGKTVLEDFDIYKTAGGKNKAIERTFEIENTNGSIKITIPKRTVNYGKFSAFKIEAGDTVIAINCGGEPYTDKEGLTWTKYEANINLTDQVIEKVKNGTPMLVLPEGPEASDAYAKKIGDFGAYNYLGHVGSVRASWMGAWYFVKDHPLMKGLPVNQAMKSYYQTSVSGSDGLLLDGDNVDAFIGFGRDHDRNIGIGGFTTTLGEGEIVFYTLPGLTGKGGGIQSLVAKKILLNAINYLKKK